MASTSNLIAMANGDSCGGGEFKNTNIDTTTRVGDVFTEMEKTDESGTGLDGFTSLWGDKYSYLTKLQLYIRSMFEKQFQDYSLRDNAMISQTFTMDKTWERSSWINPHLFSNDTYGVLVDNRDV